MRNKTFFILSGIIFFLFGVLNVNAQDPARFSDQVEQLATAKYDFNNDKKTVVFTGSSSIFKWNDVQTYFPEYNVINNGFGGSHFSDLIYFYHKLILKRAPEILFIYEGDNDIAAGKKPSSIAREAESLINMIRHDLPETQIILITPKPSIARWHLKKKYNKLNKRLKSISQKTERVELMDTWNIMLDNEGNLINGIFIQDGLHMNKKGYDIWAKEVRKFL